MSARSTQSVAILATGGTIAGTSVKPGTAVGYLPATLAVGSIVAAIRSLHDEKLELEQVAQLDSKDMDHATWQLLARRIAHHLARPEISGLVVTHGTDTIEETAYFLHRVLSPAKPVVLTAAMRPPDALLADGPQNLLDAVRLARQSARGVLTCMLGRVYAPDDVRKANGYALDAFRSGGDGIVGSMLEGRLHRFRDWPRCTPVGHETLPADVTTWPKVALALSHAGVCAASLDALVDSGVDGLVIAGTGNGTIHRSLEPSLRRAAGQGVTIWRASRCAEGGVVGEGPWPSAGRLGPAHARIELMLQLMRVPRVRKAGRPISRQHAP